VAARTNIEDNNAAGIRAASGILKIVTIGDVGVRELPVLCGGISTPGVDAHAGDEIGDDRPLTSG
jgi:hypothetical protein